MTNLPAHWLNVDFETLTSDEGDEESSFQQTPPRAEKRKRDIHSPDCSPPKRMRCEAMRLCLNYDFASCEGDCIYLDERLGNSLYEHQINGIKFMWKNLVIENGGCILAHEMGLGKTRQSAYLIYSIL